jgi:hypothetical protein
MAANMPVAGAGMPPSMPAPPPGMPGMKKGGHVKKMSSGGDDTKPSNYQDVIDAKMQAKKDAAYNAADSTPSNPKSAGAGQGTRGVPKMASGGSASSRADGIASRGKTVGKVC